MRKGPALTDEACEARLATGSMVKETCQTCQFGCCAKHDYTSCLTKLSVSCEELGTIDERLCYELVNGDGPITGWVTMKLRGKAAGLKRSDVRQKCKSTYRVYVSHSNIMCIRYTSK